MDIYLKHLVAAFYLVDEKYFSNNAYSGNWREYDDKSKKEYVQFVERVFAYELYYQFRKIMEALPTNYKDLVLNGEISKNGFKNIYKSNTIFPDLVLHKSQGCLINQELFIEIKTSPLINEESLENDIGKLIIAVGETLKYKNAVFVCINYNYKSLLENIQQKIKKANYSNYGENHPNLIEKEKFKLKEETIRKIWLLTETNGLESFDKLFKQQRNNQLKINI